MRRGRGRGRTLEWIALLAVVAFAAWWDRPLRPAPARELCGSAGGPIEVTLPRSFAVEVYRDQGWEEEHLLPAPPVGAVYVYRGDRERSPRQEMLVVEATRDAARPALAASWDGRRGVLRDLLDGEVLDRGGEAASTIADIATGANGFAHCRLHDGSRWCLARNGDAWSWVPIGHPPPVAAHRFATLLRRGPLEVRTVPEGIMIVLGDLVATLEDPSVVAFLQGPDPHRLILLHRYAASHPPGEVDDLWYRRGPVRHALSVVDLVQLWNRFSPRCRPSVGGGASND